MAARGRPHYLENGWDIDGFDPTHQQDVGSPWDWYVDERCTIIIGQTFDVST